MSPVDDFLETFAKCEGLLGDYNVPNLSREKRGEVSFFAKNISFSKILNRYRIAVVVAVCHKNTGHFTGHKK